MVSPSSKDQKAPTPELALSSLLSFEQLAELAVLVSKIADVMHKQIGDSFDAPVRTSGEQSPQRLKNIEKNPNIDQTAPQPRQETVEARARGLQAHHERELPELKLLDLKYDLLRFFQTWRDGVLSKIADVSSTKESNKIADEDSAQSMPDTSPTPDYKLLGSYINVERSDAFLIELYPPTATMLSSLPRRKKEEVLSAVLLLLLSQGHYVSYSRVLLLHIVSSFHLPLHVLAEDEIKIAQGLVAASKQMSGDEEARRRSESSQLSRKWKVGLAGIAGAALIGVTGGLAAPLVAGAIGTVMGGIGLGGTAAAGLLATISSSGVIVGGLFGAYGYGMTSKMMDEYAKEVEDFAFLPMRSSRKAGRGIGDVSAEDRRLRVTVCISGWLTHEKDVITPWSVLGKGNEVYALRWELGSLIKMGKAIESVVSSALWTAVSTEIILRTVFANLMFALWPIALLKVSKIVDNPFTVAKNRADKAGLVLADAIINKAQGDRPITLIGYSLGARLIYSCLMSLAERRAFGLVEGAVLIGTPAPSDTSVWRSIRGVVAGRLVNVYSNKDHILAFLYRTSSIQLGVAGLEEIQGVEGVENVDVSDTVNGHLRYQHSVGIILEKIGWEDIDMQEVGKEELAIEILDSEERKKRERSSVHTESKGAVDQPNQSAVPMQSRKARPLVDSGDDDKIVIREQPSTIPKPVSEPVTEEEDLISFDDYEIHELEAKPKKPERVGDPKERRGDFPTDYLHASKNGKQETEITFRGEGERGIVMRDLENDDMAMREYDEPIAIIDEENDGAGMHR